LIIREGWPPPYLALAEVTEQPTLKFVEVARLLTSPQVTDEPVDPSEASFLVRVTLDR